MKYVIQIGNELKAVSLSDAMNNITLIQFAGTESQCNQFMNIAQ